MNKKGERVGIIVVEDEVLIRMLVVEILTEEGFDVIEACNGDEAVLLLQDKADQFHVLFTDVHMPGSLDGLKLAHHTRQHWPWIAIIVASGKAQPEADELPPDSHFFQKPYDISNVVNHIRKVAA